MLREKKRINSLLGKLRVRPTEARGGGYGAINFWASSGLNHHGL